MSNQAEKNNRNQNFISFIIDRINQNKGIAATLRRADNPDTEYQSWEYLAAFGIDLENSNQRLPFAIVAAAIAKNKNANEKIANGSLGIGQTLALCYPEGNQNDQAKAKLRRLLDCDSVSEVCRVLRPILSLIKSRSIGNLDFAKLLDDLLKFQWDEARQRVKARWAQDFYRKEITEKEDE